MKPASLLSKYCTALTICVLAYAHSAQAHHAFAAEFDAGQRKEISGTVTRFQFANPHVRYYLAVEADGVQSEWELQYQNIGLLRSQGWTAETVKVGDTLAVAGSLARDGSNKLFMDCARDAAGKILGGCGQARAPEPATVTAAGEDETLQLSTREVNIGGYWNNRYNFKVTVDDLEPKPIPHTDESRRRYDAVEFGDDPGMRCLPLGLPRSFGSPFPMEVVDAGSHYLMVFLGSNVPRWVWMDGRRAVADRPLTYMGFSTGHWEGRTLVIETDHLKAGWLDGSGYPMSGGDGTRIVEEWQVSEDGNTIDRTMTIYDELYAAPLVRLRGSQRTDSTTIIENEPCNPDSFYRDLQNQGIFDEKVP